jgi:hypothetical protein
MPDIKNFEEERIILAHGFSPWLLDSVHLGRTSWWQEPHGNGASSPHGRQELDRQGPGASITLKAMTPVTYFFQLGHTS